MTKGNTAASLTRAAVVLAMAAGFVALGVASGLWVHLSILAVTFGIFLATVSVRKGERPQPSGGGRIIPLSQFGIDSIDDLDEVA